VLFRARTLLIPLVFCWLAQVTGCAGASSAALLGEALGVQSSRDRPSFTTAHGELSLSQIQLKGSHNSYHRAPRFALWHTWRYTHAPLEVQLGTQGVRQVELDVRWEKGELRIGHLPVVDGRSTCRTLDECLRQLKRWSKRHPRHLPVFVFIEPKEDVAPSRLEGKLEAIDGNITRVFSRDSLIIPEQVAGDMPTLSEAIRKRGWPSISATRGKFAFVLFGPIRHRRAYAKGRPKLEGRVMFAVSSPTKPHASILNLDHPVRERAAIDRAVREGFLVRTRADSDLVRDAGRRDAALASGAHFVGSDFVDPRYGWVELGDTAPVRCNPVSAPRACGPRSLAEVESMLWAGLMPAPEVRVELADVPN
jgi:hypothetical protein